MFIPWSGHRPSFTCVHVDAADSILVLHRERPKHLAPPRSTKEREHLRSKQTTANPHNSQTNHQAPSKGQPKNQASQCPLPAPGFAVAHGHQIFDHVVACRTEFAEFANLDVGMWKETTIYTSMVVYLTKSAWKRDHCRLCCRVLSHAGDRSAIINERHGCKHAPRTAVDAWSASLVATTKHA